MHVAARACAPLLTAAVRSRCARCRYIKPGLIFNSGGPGYLLNGAALDTFISVMNSPSCFVRHRTRAEDVMLAACLASAGVVPHDTRDALRRERFLPFMPAAHLTYRNTDLRQDWYVRYSIGLQYGVDCCSTRAAGFHYVKAPDLHRLDALLYGCRAPRANASGSSAMSVVATTRR